MTYEKLKERIEEMGLQYAKTTELLPVIEQLLNDDIDPSVSDDEYQCRLEDNKIKAHDFLLKIKGILIQPKVIQEGKNLYEILSLILPKKEIQPYYHKIFGIKAGDRIFKENLLQK